MADSISKMAAKQCPDRLFRLPKPSRPKSVRSSIIRGSSRVFRATEVRFARRLTSSEVTLILDTVSDNGLIVGFSYSYSGLVRLSK